MSKTVFFSWQSDRSTKEGRNLIEKALERAVERIARDISVEEAVRGLEMDKDTKGVPGSPPIFQTILNKIERAAVFVPDLTFVGTRIGDRPSPNPNVLIEYGYALKSRGHAQIVAVMNVAHGGPESLPFDLVQNRFPITYNVADGAPDSVRRAEREQLAKSLAVRLREVLESEEFKAKLPRTAEPPRFSFREPLRGRGRFRPPGKPIGVGHSTLASLTGSEPSTVRLSDGPAIWLRVAPVSRRENPLMKIVELERAMTLLVPLALCGFSASLGFVRGPDGFGIHNGFDDQGSLSLVYAFTNGEVWATNAWILQLSPGQIVLEEKAFSQSLELCATFLNQLGISGPYQWIAGMEGLEGRYLMKGDRFRKWGPCMRDVIEKVGTHELGADAAESLKPFFDDVYDQCGTQRAG
jgi:hypothetical protein